MCRSNAMSQRLLVKGLLDRVGPKPEEATTDVVHLVPFSTVSADGQRLSAPIDVYFRPYRVPADGDRGPLWRATFRGKPMTGLKVPMPDGYTGLLCHSEDGGGDFVADADRGQVVKDVMYWNWDRVPTDDDPLLAALCWTRVSEAMMSP